MSLYAHVITTWGTSSTLEEKSAITYARNRNVRATNYKSYTCKCHCAAS